MTFLRRRSAGRSCPVHGDNGCELQGEAGPRTRAQDARAWRADIGGDLRRSSGASRTWWAVMAPGMGDAEGLRTDWTTEPGPKETP